MFEKLNFQGKLWRVVNKVKINNTTNHTQLKKNYGCDLVLRNDTHFWILNEIIDVEFEDLK